MLAVYACLPPCDTVCGLTFAALIGVGIANRVPGDQSAPRPPIPPRVWGRLGLYVLFLIVFCVGMLLWGIWLHPRG